MKLNELPDIVMLQETRCNTLEDKWVERLWGSPNLCYIQKPNVGKSGIMQTIWDPNILVVNEVVEKQFYLAIKGRWKGKNKETIVSWGDISAISLDRHTSDHCPIILRDKNEDFGPKPFKMFDVWLDSKEVEKVITEAWKKPVYGTKLDCVFRDRLKNVKVALREWSKRKYGLIDVEIETLKKETTVLELKADAGNITEEERVTRLNNRAQWLKKENEKADMIRQKARIKWVAEGEDNTSFFHASIRRKNNNCNIRGLHTDGIWNENPSEIKNAIYEFYGKIFEDKREQVPDYSSMAALLFNRISTSDSQMLEEPFSDIELWDAIKESESNKAPGPDGLI
ncbi:uncharacterized protein [Rutidosis leptorrhynchoides]|uniref:uncharacterized protein n=1 Tax=Rutidosis leptorrhynchoides TaxID=125765 RepID=UPI003A998001